MTVESAPFVVHCGPVDKRDAVQACPLVQTQERGMMPLLLLNDTPVHGITPLVKIQIAAPPLHRAVSPGFQT